MDRTSEVPECEAYFWIHILKVAEGTDYRVAYSRVRGWKRSRGISSRRLVDYDVIPISIPGFHGWPLYRVVQMARLL